MSLPSEPACVTPKGAHITPSTEARTVLLSVLSDVGLCFPGTQPFNHRIPVARKNAGSRETALTRTMDELIADL